MPGSSLGGSSSQEAPGLEDAPSALQSDVHEAKCRDNRDRFCFFFKTVRDASISTYFS